MTDGRLGEDPENNVLPDGQNSDFTLIDPTYGSAGYNQGQVPIASV